MSAARGAAAAVVMVGVIMAGTGVAHAGAYTSQTSCATAALGNRICIDVWANTVTIYSSNTVIYAQETSPGSVVSTGGPTPTKGWIGYDFESNANASTVTTMVTGSGYGLNSATVSVYAGSGVHTWNSWPVSQNMANLVAWFANSNTGFELVLII